MLTLGIIIYLTFLAVHMPAVCGPRSPHRGTLLQALNRFVTRLLWVSESTIHTSEQCYH